jgi:hypothetical protein
MTMILNRNVDPILERLIVVWHHTEAFRDMPELFFEDKLAQIPNAATAAIGEAWEYLGHNRRNLKSAFQIHLARDRLEYWAGKKRVKHD